MEKKLVGFQCMDINVLFHNKFGMRQVKFNLSLIKKNYEKSNSTSISIDNYIIIIIFLLFIILKTNKFCHICQSLRSFSLRVSFIAPLTILVNQNKFIVSSTMQVEIQ